MLRVPTFARIVLGMLILFSAGCQMIPRKPTIPIQTVLKEAPSKESADTLVIVLPGRGDRVERLAERGLHAQIQDRFPRADVLFVDAHLGYYLSRTLPTRMDEDVLLPDRLKKYKELWVMGASLGGMGSVLLAGDPKIPVSRIFLLAPFLGNKDAPIDEVRAAGSLDAWTPNPAPSEKEAPFVRLWTNLQTLTRENSPVEVWLGWGTEDSLHETIELLARELPERQVVPREGGHRWKVWEAALNDMLDEAAK